MEGAMKRRLKSSWHCITVLDDKNNETQIYELDPYGRLMNKFQKNKPRNISNELQNLKARKPSPFRIYLLPILSSNNTSSASDGSLQEKVRHEMIGSQNQGQGLLPIPLLRPNGIPVKNRKLSIGRGESVTAFSHSLSSQEEIIPEMLWFNFDETNDLNIEDNVFTSNALIDFNEFNSSDDEYNFSQFLSGFPTS